MNHGMKTAGVDGRVEAMRLAGWLYSVRDSASTRERECRIAGVLFLTAAIYAGCVLTTVGGSFEHTVQLTLLAGYAISGAVCFVLPGRSMPEWTALALAGWWLTLLTVGEGAVGGVLGAYVVGYLLVFMYIGMTSSPAMILGAAVLAEAALAVSALLGNQQSDRTILAASIVVTAAVGQIPALAIIWGKRVYGLVSHVRRSLEQLSTVSSENEAADQTAKLVAHLVDADAAMVFLTEHTGSTNYVRRGGYSPGTREAELRIDIDKEQSGLVVLARTGQSLYLSDARESTVESQKMVKDLGMVSVLYLPISGDGGMIGAVIAWWTSRRSVLDPLSLRLAETATIPAGQILQQARNLGRMDAPAMRDPLTGVGNRRRLDLALADLPVGGTILLFDLDAFAALNDMYGRQTGDEALRSFGEALRRSVRQNDLVARAGSDQFAVVLPASVSSIASGIIIERLQRAWRSPQGCRFSVGVAIRTENESPIEAFARAEVDLRTTKRLKTR